jgi:dTDP-glucose pyrophosphorylase
MLSIIIPMAGAGRRFAEAGYGPPKPLIPIHGVPMIRLVIGNLRPKPPISHRFVFVLQETMAPGIAPLLHSWAPGCTVQTVPALTAGAAATVLAARHMLPASEPLLIANCDQWLSQPVDGFLTSLDQVEPRLDGAIMTMRATDPKWSFVARGPDGLVTRVAEKVPISDEATVGLYLFARAGDFITAAEAMVADDERVNGEFYVAPVYNRLIATGARIGAMPVGDDGAGMHGLGTPSDLEAFLTHPVSRRAAAEVGPCAT